MDECMQDLAAVWNEGKELYNLLAILARRGIFDEDVQRGMESLTQIAVDNHGAVICRRKEPMRRGHSRKQQRRCGRRWPVGR